LYGVHYGAMRVTKSTFESLSVFASKNAWEAHRQLTHRDELCSGDPLSARRPSLSDWVSATRAASCGARRLRLAKSTNRLRDRRRESSQARGPMGTLSPASSRAPQASRCAYFAISPRDAPDEWNCRYSREVWPPEKALDRERGLPPTGAI